VGVVPHADVKGSLATLTPSPWATTRTGVATSVDTPWRMEHDEQWVGPLEVGV